MVEFLKLIFRIGFTVVTTCAKCCSKKLERLCAKEVYTFIMDSEAITENRYNGSELVDPILKQVACLANVCWEVCSIYVYSISVFINK